MEARDLATPFTKPKSLKLVAQSLAIVILFHGKRSGCVLAASFAFPHGGSTGFWTSGVFGCMTVELVIGQGFVYKVYARRIMDS